MHDLNPLRPLVVDLDGTLIKTDLLVEAANRALIQQPWRWLQLPAWFLMEKAALKKHLAAASSFDAASLPYNQTLLTWLREEHARGRPIVLATASHESLARQVAMHLGLFTEVLATNDSTNLRADAKRDTLIQRFGEKGFDYVGNDWPDLPVWRCAMQAHIVGGKHRLIERIRSRGNLGRTVEDGRPHLSRALLTSVRPHQWTKNLLVFVPLLAAHRWGDAVSAVAALLAFLAFCLCASAVYLLNDLADMSQDRRHPRKRGRPLAAGHLGPLAAWLSWPILLLLAFALAFSTLPVLFTASLAAYFIITAAYSLALKRIPMVDVVTLAVLYTLRIVAGAAAIGVAPSFWLLAFSMCLFHSLALMKRHSELVSEHNADLQGSLPGRGYSARHLRRVLTLGGVTACTAVLVLALYVQDSHTAALYPSPHVIWLACPLLSYWVSRAWLLSHRGQMHDDPIVFALTDRVSWIVVALVVLVFALAKLIP